MIYKRSTASETVSKNILLEGLNRFHGPNLTLSSDRDQERHIDVWFAWKTPSLSMHHLQKHLKSRYKKEIKQR